MDISKRIMPYRDEITRRLSELIQIRSVLAAPADNKPYGEGIHNALSYMLQLAESLGFRVKNVNGYAGHAEYGEGEGLIGVLVHLDTVPEGEGWTVPPFGGLVQDGVVFGRGASDNKGPAVVALYALKALHDAGILPRNRIRIIFGTDEENGMRDMEHYFAVEPVPDLGFSPDAGYPIIHAEKGILFLNCCLPLSSETAMKEANGGTAPNVVPERCTVTLLRTKLNESDAELLDCAANPGREDVFVKFPADDLIEVHGIGETAHGSVPEKGKNAISRVCSLLGELRTNDTAIAFFRFLQTAIGEETNGESLGIACSDEVSGSLTLNLGKLMVENNELRITLDIRYPVTTNGDALLDKLSERMQEDGVRIDVNRHLRPLYVPEEHVLIQSLHRAYKTVIGETAGVETMGGGTYARTLGNNGVAFGANFPGTDTRAHRADEFIRMDDLMLHAQICTQALYELVSLPSLRAG